MQRHVLCESSCSTCFCLLGTTPRCSLSRWQCLPRCLPVQNEALCDAYCHLLFFLHWRGQCTLQLQPAASLRRAAPEVYTVKNVATLSPALRNPSCCLASAAWWRSAFELMGRLLLLSCAFGGCRHARQRYPTRPATLHCRPPHCGTSATSRSASWSLGCAPLPCSTMRVTAKCESQRCACQRVVLLSGSSCTACRMKCCGLAESQLSGQLDGTLGKLLPQV